MGEWRRWRRSDGHAQGIDSERSKPSGWSCCFCDRLVGEICKPFPSANMERPWKRQGFVRVRPRIDKRPHHQVQKQLHVRQHNHQQQPFDSKGDSRVSRRIVRSLAPNWSATPHVYWRLQTVSTWLEQTDASWVLQWRRGSRRIV